MSLKVVSTHEVTRGRTAHVASVVRGGCLGENFVLEADSDADESGEHGDESGGEGEGEGESESGGAEGAGGLSPCTARCAKYTELTSVSRPGLTPIFDEYPEFEHQVHHCMPRHATPRHAMPRHASHVVGSDTQFCSIINPALKNQL